jgi:hypothetical protein
MALFYDTAGSPIQIATPQINYGALASVRPLSWGQNPLQFAPSAPWVVPEEKPYIAQGLGQAASGIAQGLLEARKAKTEKERQKAIDDREIAKETARNAREDARDTARATLEGKREDARLTLEREKLKAAKEIAETKARVNAVSVGDALKPMTLDDQVDPLSIASQDQPAIAEVPAPVVRVDGGIDQFNKSASSVGMPPIGGKPAFNLLQPPTPATVPAPVVAPAAAPAPASLLKLATPQTPVSAPAVIPPPVTPIAPEAKVKAAEATPLSGVDLTKSPALGTKEAEKDKSRVSAVLDTPDPGTLTGISLKAEQPSPKKDFQFQKVNEKDMLVDFGNNATNAFIQASRFNNKYPNAAVKAEVQRYSLPQGGEKYIVQYPSVREEREKTQRDIQSHISAEKGKESNLDFKREAKVGNMAKNYEMQPSVKLMSTREDTMGRMLVAYQNRKNATNDTAKSTIDQELKELFVMFASGKAPTEAQFAEISHAFPGIGDYFPKRMEFFRSGATLTEAQVETIKNLMLETYNNSANQVNSSMDDISYILKKEHPNIDPIKLPVKHPILETEESLKEEMSHLKEKLHKDPSFKNEYDRQAAELVKKREFLISNGIPSNLHEIQRPARKPGFHSYLFSPSPDLSYGQPISQ